MNLARYAYTDLGVLGRLTVRGNDEPLYTIERPWLPGASPGGRPSVSCVPDGRYDLLRHARPNGDVCVALRNPDLGVYYSTESIAAGGSGRTLILIHAANFVDELEGCCAPGLAFAISQNRFMVANSREAMTLVMAAWDAGDRKLVIAPALGATDE
jgi:hypothetical protein